MKCYRVLYRPDDTAFMVWAENKYQARQIAHDKNRKELPPDQEIDLTDYNTVEFTPGTNSIGILTFYDVYNTFERTNVPAETLEPPDKSDLTEKQYVELYNRKWATIYAQKESLDEPLARYFQKTATPQETIGYYLSKFGENAWSEWFNNCTEKRLSKTKQEINERFAKLKFQKRPTKTTLQPALIQFTDDAGNHVTYSMDQLLFKLGVPQTTTIQIQTEEQTDITLQL